MTEESLAAPPLVEEPGPGAMLARARAERQLSIAAVAERLKYAARQIEALEADDYAHLPGTTIVRGMVRGYAKLVGMDATLVLQALERRHIPALASVDLRTQRIPFPDRSKRGTWLYVALSVVALLAMVAVLYEWHLEGPAPAQPSVSVAPAQPSVSVAPAQPSISVAPAPPLPEPRPEAASPAPEAAAVAAVAAAGAPARRNGAARIQMEFQKESWVEIKDRGGRTLLSQLNSAGTRRVVEGTPPFSVVIGNAASVRLQYNDAPVDLRPYVKVEVARLTLE